jgi:hypothetical protein
MSDHNGKANPSRVRDITKEMSEEELKKATGGYIGERKRTCPALAGGFFGQVRTRRDFALPTNRIAVSISRFVTRNTLPLAGECIAHRLRTISGGPRPWLPLFGSPTWELHAHVSGAFLRGI